jgi:iron complex transport system substrate-binding protein
MAASLSVTDDAGNRVTLPGPALRVISLAPHTTELLYAAGVANRMVAAVDFSDYPPAARQLPRVGSNTSLDLERIIAFKPDLIVVWRHGNASRQIDALKAFHIPMFFSDPRHLSDIAPTLRKLGVLLGTQAQADQSADAFDARIAALRSTYASRSPVSVFYQVWGAPLITLNGSQIVSDVLGVCGGVNVFAALPEPAPTVSTEAVLAVDPLVMLAPSIGATSSATPLASLDAWRKWPQLRAVKAGNLFMIDGDLINRPGPRLADGAEQVCQDLDAARRRAAGRAP